ncbi:MAG: NAD(P)-binding domain-containing protein, partial [Halioglobus sp.]
MVYFEVTQGARALGDGAHARQARSLGLRFVDAPVSGGQAGAENGALSIMCGGTQGDYQAAAAVFGVYAA